MGDDVVGSAPEQVVSQPTPPQNSAPQAQEQDWKAAYEALQRQYASKEGNNAQLIQARKALEAQLKTSTDTYEAKLDALRAERDAFEKQIADLKKENQTMQESVSKIQKRFDFLTQHPELSEDVFEGILVIDDVEGEALEQRVTKYKQRIEGALNAKRQEKQSGAAPPPPPNASPSGTYTPAQIKELYNMHLTRRTLDTPEGQQIRSLFFEMVDQGMLR